MLVAACGTRAAPPAGGANAGAASAGGGLADAGRSRSVAIPAGQFVRGRDEPDRLDEAPKHVVHVSAFTLDVTLVTRAAFAKFVEETGYVTTAEQNGYGIGAREGMEDWAWERMPHASWRRPFVEREPDADTRAF